MLASIRNDLKADICEVDNLQNFQKESEIKAFGLVKSTRLFSLVSRQLVSSSCINVWADILTWTPPKNVSTTD